MLNSVYMVDPRSDYTVNVYFDNGAVKRYNAKPLLEQGGRWDALKDYYFFQDNCIVMNGTLAWDLSGKFDPSNCLDICPDVLYEQSELLDESEYE